MADQSPADTIGIRSIHELATIVLSDDLKKLMPKEGIPFNDFHTIIQTLLLIEICSSLNVLKQGMEEVK